MMKKVIAAALMLALLMTAVGAGAEALIRDVLGAVKGAEYENEVLGIGFRAPRWRLATQEEIAEINKLTGEMLTGKAKEILSESGSLQVMVAGYMNTPNNVNITVTNLGGQAAMMEMMGVRTVMEFGKDTLVSVMKDAGIADVQVDIVDYTVDGRQVTGYRMEYTMQGVHLIAYQPSYISGPYMVTITMTGSAEEDVEQILTYFYWL